MPLPLLARPTPDTETISMQLQALVSESSGRGGRGGAGSSLAGAGGGRPERADRPPQEPTVAPEVRPPCARASQLLPVCVVACTCEVRVCVQVGLLCTSS